MSFRTCVTKMAARFVDGYSKDRRGVERSKQHGLTDQAMTKSSEEKSTTEDAQAHERITADLKARTDEFLEWLREGGNGDVADLITSLWAQHDAQAERIVQLEAENAALLKEVGRPRGGRICPQDGGVCWEEQCGVRFCEIRALESALAQATQALRGGSGLLAGFDAMIDGDHEEIALWVREHEQVLRAFLVAAALSASPHEESRT